MLWTASRDAQIRQLRHEGSSWDAIAASLGVSRNAVLERGRQIGAKLPPPSPDEPEEDLLDPAREPLPAGHAVTWDAITAGTFLAGQAYPWPPVPDRE